MGLWKLPDKPGASLHRLTLGPTPHPLVPRSSNSIWWELLLLSNSLSSGDPTPAPEAAIEEHVSICNWKYAQVWWPHCYNKNHQLSWNEDKKRWNNALRNEAADSRPLARASSCSEILLDFGSIFFWCNNHRKNAQGFKDNTNYT